jgi:hypothetical protein
LKAIVTSVNNKVIKQTHALMGATASHLQVVAEHLTLLDKAEEEDAEVVKAELDSKKSAKVWQTGSQREQLLAERRECRLKTVRL